MTQSEGEKIAIVLINRYKNMVDYFKKWRPKSAFAYIQTAEIELYNFTEDKPIARKFFERILEYRRKNADGIETFKIPRIEPDSSGEQESPPAAVPKSEHREAVAVAEKSAPEKAKAEQEESPFEF